MAETFTKSQEVTIRVDGDRCEGCQFLADEECTLYNKELRHYPIIRCQQCLDTFGYSVPTCPCGQPGTVEIRAYDRLACLCPDCWDKFLKGEL